MPARRPARPAIQRQSAQAGVAGLQTVAPRELAPHGITVNALAPGFVPTDATTALHADPKFNEWNATHAPLGRWCDPAELAGPAVFLASDAASYVAPIEFVGGFVADLAAPTITSTC
jgi:NAD(P)-dependent dehydrogenase (short-subunit alcohol dehydrogenase family)